MLCLLISGILFAIPAASAGESSTAEAASPGVDADSPTVEGEDTAAEEPPPPKLRLFYFGLGMGNPDAEALNRYIDHVNATRGGTVDKIDNYGQLAVGIEVPLRDSLHLGFGLDALWARVGGKTDFLARRVNFDIGITAIGAETYLRPIFNDVIGKADLDVLAGGGLYLAGYWEEEGPYYSDGYDAGFGARLGAGFSVPLGKKANLRLEGGHRWLKFDGFTDDDGDAVRFFAPGLPRAEVDFSGYYWTLMINFPL
jgi:hypothetical protein